jgi:hypothetical protein
MMSTNISKAQLIAELQDEQAAYEALLNSFDDTRMTEPGIAGEWSMKDVVAHLTGWRKRTVSRLQAIQRNESVPAPYWPSNLQDDDEINAWIFEANRDRSLADIRQEDRAVFQQLVDTISAFNETEPMDPRLVAWLDGAPLTGATFFGHFHEEHEADIRAWLNKHQ